MSGQVGKGQPTRTYYDQIEGQIHIHNRLITQRAYNDDANLCQGRSGWIAVVFAYKSKKIANYLIYTSFFLILLHHQFQSCEVVDDLYTFYFFGVGYMINYMVHLQRTNRTIWYWYVEPNRSQGGEVAINSLLMMFTEIIILTQQSREPEACRCGLSALPDWKIFVLRFLYSLA